MTVLLSLPPHRSAGEFMSQPGGGTGHRVPVPTSTLIGAVGRPGEDDRRERVSDIGAFLGLDVGKDEHHATAVTPAGKKAFDKRPPNSESSARCSAS
ncbi:hypothetical protein ACFRCW_46590 [Streptomyces sp. NPDC056653]|uniref:hypothetical protein n=1 Tax=Streptomyces sp. NPDC056653 TaxID=3345894 RepID=UPI0036BD93DC